MQTDGVQIDVNTALSQVRRHPFIREAHRKTASREQGIRWVYCAGRESRSFPWILRDLLAWTTEPKISEILQENLDDELGNGDPTEAHFRHYQHLLSALGVELESFDNYDEGSGIQHALSLAFNVAASGDGGRALGYMLVNEAMTPVTYEAARSVLTSHFPGLNTNFFDLHIEVDEHHVEALYQAVRALDDDAEDAVRFGIELGQRGMEVLLDEAYGVLDPRPERVFITEPRWDPTTV